MVIDKNNKSFLTMLSAHAKYVSLHSKLVDHIADRWIKNDRSSEKEKDTENFIRTRMDDAYKDYLQSEDRFFAEMNSALEKKS